jgi:RNA polymerase sigma-70 factor, ECF subfamily
VGILLREAGICAIRVGAEGMSQCADRHSGRWISDLNAAGYSRQAARARLKDLLTGIAEGEVQRRGWAGTTIAGQGNRAPAAATAAVTAITGAIDSYRGDSRFTSWAAKFVLRELTDAAGRGFWRPAAWPADLADWQERIRCLAGAAADETLIVALCHAVACDLSGQQRTAFTAATSGTLPPEALAAGLGPNRNAIYQALFEARRKIAARLSDGATGLPRPAQPRHGQGASWLDALLAADPGDTGCDLAFQALDRYAEADQQQTRPMQRFPGVAAHLARCGPCGQDYQGLLAAIAAASASAANPAHTSNAGQSSSCPLAGHQPPGTQARRGWSRHLQ